MRRPKEKKMRSNIFKLFTPITVISLILSACTPSVSVSMAESNLKRETDPKPAEGGIADLVNGNNGFALDLYHALRSDNGNLILSPYSISLALAMTYAGAHGETESQMAQALHFSAQDQLHPSFNALDLELQRKPLNINKDQEPMQLSIANSVWAEQTYTFLPEFLDTVAVNYGAGISLTDFKTKPNNARIAINNWVSDKTEEKIKELLPSGTVSPDTRMVLVNAIYFKADWLTKFEENKTANASFNLLDGTVIVAMKMKGHFFNVPYMQGNGVQAVELPYAGETTAMDIIVPDAGNFEAFDSSFNKQTYDEILNAMQPVSLTLGLPKFKFDQSFGLAETLQGLGMTDAFNGDIADFSGMTGKQDLYIGDVIHKAFIAVDEEGTEAAAATAVIMETASAIMLDVNLQIDRPFIFIIRNTVNGQILFIGRMTNPAQ